MIIVDSIRDFLNYRYYKYLVDHPRKVIDKIWNKQMGYPICWDNPRDLNEKIEWLICYGDTSKWPDLADKYKVREYITKKGYSHMLTELYGVWTDARSIDFDKLPNKFILKCNHDCGSYCIVDKSCEYDKQEIIKKLNHALKNKYGYKYCEPHYNKIRPLVIAEEFLEEKTENPISTSLIDYKVWCFNGKPYYIWVCRNREHHGTEVSLFDLDWRWHPEKSVFTSHYPNGGGNIPRPPQLEEMLKVAAVLSDGFPEVCVDFYIVNSKVYFGELTFTRNAGRIEHFNKTFLKELGDLCRI